MNNQSSKDHALIKEEAMNEELRLLFGRKQDLRVSCDETMPPGSQIILDTNWFLRKLNTITLGVTVAVIAVAIILTIALVHVSSRPPLEMAFKEDVEGNMVSMSRTVVTEVTQEDALIYAADRVKQFSTFAYTDWLDRLVELGPEFISQTAYENFQIQMESSRIITMVLEQKGLSTAVPLKAPRIVDYIEGTQTWVIQMEFALKIGGGGAKVGGGNMRATIHIQKVPRSFRIKGMAVSKYLIEEIY